MGLYIIVDAALLLLLRLSEALLLRLSEALAWKFSKWWVDGVCTAAAVARNEVYVQCLAARDATHHSNRVVHKAASWDDACCQCQRSCRLSSVHGCAHVYMYTGEGGWWCAVTDTFTCQQRAPWPEYLLSIAQWHSVWERGDVW